MLFFQSAISLCVAEGTFVEEVGGLHKKEFRGLAQVFFGIGVAVMVDDSQMGKPYTLIHLHIFNKIASNIIFLADWNFPIRKGDLQISPFRQNQATT